MIRVAVAHAGSERNRPANWCRSKPRDFLCLGCHGSGAELLRRGPREKPDVLVVDTAVLDGDGVEPVRKLKQRLPELRIVVISEQTEAPAITAWLMSGAQGYLVKPVHRPLLEDAVKRVVRRQMAFSPEVFLQILSTFKPGVGPVPECKLLSRRERQILTYLAMNYEHKEIGPLLKIAENIVHWHVQRICQKLRVRNGTAALKKFLGSGLFPAFNLQEPSSQPAQSTAPVRTLREFKRRFATGDACRKYLAALRWPDGFCCPYCSGRRAWRMSRGLWLCEQCRHQISFTSGTMFHDTRLPLPIWLRIAWELAANHRLRAADLLRILPLGGYKTAWTCLKKLRRCLGESSCLKDGEPAHCGDRFACILQRALEMPPQPFKKLIARSRRKRESRE
jgi:DNA-binding NarL/FixJ family response regulator/ribosomal protein L37AE/L43A